MYLGELGRMIPIECPVAQRVEASPRYSFQRTLGGAVKAQAGPVGRRVWDVQLGELTTPSQVATLMDFADGAWGVGPFWFIPTDAPVVNMLTPQGAACTPSAMVMRDGAELLGSPPMDLGADGYAARSVWKTPIGVTKFGPPVPVVPGRPVTGSAWVVGGGRLRLRFLNVVGESVGTVNSDRRGGTSPRRLSVTADVPPGAVSVELEVVGLITQAARPAVTWTTQPYEWGDGQVCPKAVVYNTSRDVTKAWDHPTTGRWSDLSFTVQEVG